MLKLNNSQRRVLGALVRYGPLTRREICASVNLSWAAVSKIVQHLQDLELVIDSDERDSNNRGRRPGFVAMNPETLILGVSINREVIKTVSLDLTGRVTNSETALLTDGDDPVPEAVKLLSKLMKKLSVAPVIALGVSFPGLIDVTKQEVAFSVNFPEFVNRPVAEEFRLALQLDAPVFIERNAVCDITRLVTNRRLSGDAILVSLHSGVSAAVYIDGQILHGKSGNIGELGHLKLRDGAIPCACGGVGCVETVVGGLAWSRKYRKALRGRRSEGLPARFADALDAAVPEAVAILRETLSALCPVLSEITTLLRPDTLVFSADVPESTALVFSTVINEGFESVAPEVVLAEPFSTAAGAAALGLLWLSGNPHYKA
ncbi:MAG: ROK family transcriptional regulator [Kiritimatiellaeota bacterium]|nr:ROK family transcriptional regulator [Kiritimatiellota bacterium]